jgi:acetone carboxylase gamma subunit
LPTVPERVKQWKHSAKDYWRDSEPQLADLYSRLASENNSGMKPYLEYISGRMDLLRFRADLPSNPILRAIKVIPKMSNYCHYFNGWKSMIKDLIA